MKVAITGGAGFIGANLVRALRMAEPTWQITVLDDLSTGSRANLAGIPDVIVYEASILNDVALDAAFEVADAVVHLAARTTVQRSRSSTADSDHSDSRRNLRMSCAVASSCRWLSTVVSKSRRSWLRCICISRRSLADHCPSAAARANEGITSRCWN